MNANLDVTREEQKALEYVQGLKGFYKHLSTYIVVISGLLLINFLTVPDDNWAIWPAMGWGIGLLFHGIKTFQGFNLFGPEWEKRQVEKRLGRKLWIDEERRRRCRTQPIRQKRRYL